jgi:hypothetical protein
VNEINILCPSNHSKLKNKEKCIIDKYILGFGIKTISNDFCVSQNAIKRLLLRNNIILRNRKESRNTKEYNKTFSISRSKIKDRNIIDKILEQYNDNIGCTELSKTYDVTPRTILNILRKNNIEIRNFDKQKEFQKLEKTKNRIKLVNNRKYGTDNPMQNSNIFEKSNLNKYKYKSCIIEGVLFDRLQGFEEQGILHLLQKYPEININDIISGRCSNIPKIYYIQKRSRVYFPDIYIKKLNLLVEVKCEYTFKYDIDNNMNKKKASIDAGYEHLIIVFSNDGKTHLYNI